MGGRGKKGAPGNRRRQAAALNVAGLGVVLIVLPHVIGNGVIGAAFRPLWAIGWLLVVAGGILAWVLRHRADAPGKPDAAQIMKLPERAPRRPSAVPPQVKRIDPAAPEILADGSPEVRPATWSAAVFAVIEWRRFEALVEALFAQAGFQTRSQSHGPDDGVDVWLHSKSQPDGAPVSVVQCKHWQGKRVGVDKVRELRGVMASRGVARGQFATTSTFTPDAIAFAQANGIKLHDIDGLLGLIATRAPAQQHALLDVALEGEYWRPTCVNCGVKMIDRRPRQGGHAFWGCVNYPRCRTTMQQRAGGQG